MSTPTSFDQYLRDVFTKGIELSAMQQLSQQPTVGLASETPVIPFTFGSVPPTVQAAPAPVATPTPEPQVSMQPLPAMPNASPSMAPLMPDAPILNDPNAPVIEEPATPDANAPYFDSESNQIIDPTIASEDPNKPQSLDLPPELDNWQSSPGEVVRHIYDYDKGRWIPVPEEYFVALNANGLIDSSGVPVQQPPMPELGEEATEEDLNIWRTALPKKTIQGLQLQVEAEIETAKAELENAYSSMQLEQVVTKPNTPQNQDIANKIQKLEIQIMDKEQEKKEYEYLAWRLYGIEPPMSRTQKIMSTAMDYFGPVLSKLEWFDKGSKFVRQNIAGELIYRYATTDNPLERAAISLIGGPTIQFFSFMTTAGVGPAGDMSKEELRAIYESGGAKAIWEEAVAAVPENEGWNGVARALYLGAADTVYDPLTYIPGAVMATKGLSTGSKVGRYSYDALRIVDAMTNIPGYAVVGGVRQSGRLAARGLPYLPYGEAVVNWTKPGIRGTATIMSNFYRDSRGALSEAVVDWRMGGSSGQVIRGGQPPTGPVPGAVPFMGNTTTTPNPSGITPFPGSPTTPPAGGFTPAGPQPTTTTAIPTSSPVIQRGPSPILTTQQPTSTTLTPSTGTTIAPSSTVLIDQTTGTVAPTTTRPPAAPTSVPFERVPLERQEEVFIQIQEMLLHNDSVEDSWDMSIGNLSATFGIEEDDARILLDLAEKDLWGTIPQAVDPPFYMTADGKHALNALNPDDSGQRLIDVGYRNVSDAVPGSEMWVVEARKVTDKYAADPIFDNSADPLKNQLGSDRYDRGGYSWKQKARSMSLVADLMEVWTNVARKNPSEISWHGLGEDVIPFSGEVKGVGSYSDTLTDDLFELVIWHPDNKKAEAVLEYMGKYGSKTVDGRQVGGVLLRDDQTGKLFVPDWWPDVRDELRSARKKYRESLRIFDEEVQDIKLRVNTKSTSKYSRAIEKIARAARAQDEEELEKAVKEAVENSGRKNVTTDKIIDDLYKMDGLPTTTTAAPSTTTSTTAALVVTPPPTTTTTPTATLIVDPSDPSMDAVRAKGKANVARAQEKQQLKKIAEVTKDIEESIKKQQLGDDEINRMMKGQQAPTTTTAAPTTTTAAPTTTTTAAPTTTTTPEPEFDQNLYDTLVSQYKMRTGKMSLSKSEEQAIRELVLTKEAYGIGTKDGEALIRSTDPVRERALHPDDSKDGVFYQRALDAEGTKLIGLRPTIEGDPRIPTEYADYIWSRVQSEGRDGDLHWIIATYRTPNGITIEVPFAQLSSRQLPDAAFAEGGELWRAYSWNEQTRKNFVSLTSFYDADNSYLPFNVIGDSPADIEYQQAMKRVDTYLKRAEDADAQADKLRQELASLPSTEDNQILKAEITRLEKEALDNWARSRSVKLSAVMTWRDKTISFPQARQVLFGERNAADIPDVVPAGFAAEPKSPTDIRPPDRTTGSTMREYVLDAQPVIRARKKNGEAITHWMEIHDQSVFPHTPTEIGQANSGDFFARYGEVVNTKLGAKKKGKNAIIAGSASSDKVITKRQFNNTLQNAKIVVDPDTGKLRTFRRGDNIPQWGNGNAAEKFLKKFVIERDIQAGFIDLESADYARWATDSAETFATVFPKYDEQLQAFYHYFYGGLRQKTAAKTAFQHTDNATRIITHITEEQRDAIDNIFPDLFTTKETRSGGYVDQLMDDGVTVERVPVEGRKEYIVDYIYEPVREEIVAPAKMTADSIPDKGEVTTTYKEGLQVVGTYKTYEYIPRDPDRFSSTMHGARDLMYSISQPNRNHGGIDVSLAQADDAFIDYTQADKWTVYSHRPSTSEGIEETVIGYADTLDEAKLMILRDFRAISHDTASVIKAEVRKHASPSSIEKAFTKEEQYIVEVEKRLGRSLTKEEREMVLDELKKIADEPKDSDASLRFAVDFSKPFWDTVDSLASVPRREIEDVPEYYLTDAFLERTDPIAMAYKNGNMSAKMAETFDQTVDISKAQTNYFDKKELKLFDELTSPDPGIAPHKVSVIPDDLRKRIVVKYSQEMGIKQDPVKYVKHVKLTDEMFTKLLKRVNTDTAPPILKQLIEGVSYNKDDVSKRWFLKMKADDYFAKSPTGDEEANRFMLKLEGLYGGPPGKLESWTTAFRHAVMYNIVRFPFNISQDTLFDYQTAIATGNREAMEMTSKLIKEDIAAKARNKVQSFTGGPGLPQHQSATFAEASDFASKMGTDLRAGVISQRGGRADERDLLLVEEAESWWETKGRSFGKYVDRRVLRGKQIKGVGAGERVFSTIGQLPAPTVVMRTRNAFDDLKRVGVNVDYAKRHYNETLEKFFSEDVADVAKRTGVSESVIRKHIMDNSSTYFGAEVFDPKTIIASLDGVIDKGQAQYLARRWRGKTTALWDAAEAQTNSMLHSYIPNRIDDQLAKVWMFHYWATRSSVLHAKLALENPRIMAAYFRTFRGVMNQEENEELPEWARMFVGVQAGPFGLMGLVSPGINLVLMSVIMDVQGIDPQHFSFIDALSILPMKPWLNTAATMTLSERLPNPLGDAQTRSFVKTSINAIRNLSGLPIDDGLTEDFVANFYYRLQRISHEYASGAIPKVEPLTNSSPHDKDIQSVKYYAIDILQASGKFTNPDGSITDYAGDVIANIDAGIFAGDVESQALARFSHDQMAGAIGKSLIFSGTYPTVIGQQRANARAARESKYAENRIDWSSRPGPNTPTPTFIDPQDIEVSPEQEAAKLAVTLGDSASSEYINLNTKMSQYKALGSTEQQEVYRAYNDAIYEPSAVFQSKYGGDGMFIGGNLIPYQQWDMMSEGAKREYMNIWLQESGFKPGFDEYVALRSQFEANNPVVTNYLRWQAAINDMGPGAVLNQLLRDSEQFRLWWDDENPDPTMYRVTLMSEPAYIAAMGYQPNVYTPTPSSPFGSKQQNPDFLLDSIAPPEGATITKESFAAMSTGEKVKHLTDQADRYRVKLEGYDKEVFRVIGVTYSELGEGGRIIADGQLRAAGLKEPEPSQILGEYIQWAQRQPAGADVSPRAYAIWYETNG